MNFVFTLLLLNIPKAFLFRYYEGYCDFSRFLFVNGAEKILLLSREPRRVKKVLTKIAENATRTLLIFDEVHGAGAMEFREVVGGLLGVYPYRLGLSATPIREFDAEGTQFLENEIGPVIFQFNLAEAIRRGILCHFYYIPLYYTLTVREKRKKQSIISVYEKKRKNGDIFLEEEMYRKLARVNKLAENKLLLFDEYLKEHPEILKNCIIFVETREYGLEVQKILLKYMYKFHTYYGDDDKINLIKFAKEKMDCLITCRKISEGINIHSVRNIVLFSSDRSRLTTIQRIGRSLRRGNNDEKEATVIDFVYSPENQKEGDITADQEREKWLTDLSKIREEGWNDKL